MPIDRPKILQAFGLDPNKPLPAEGTEVGKYLDLAGLGRVLVFILPKAARYHPSGRRVVQRLQAQCPKCGRQFALGNLAQHMGHGDSASTWRDAMQAWGERQ
jgi:ribosomal protein S27AE